MSHDILLPRGKYLWPINTPSYPRNKANQDICYSYSTGPGIYGSKPTRVRGQGQLRVAITPWQPCYIYYIEISVSQLLL